MGILNSRNLRRAKSLLEKNRHKVGDVVGRAANGLDKVSGGKTSNLSKKAEDAARKYSRGSSATHHGCHPDAVSRGYDPSMSAQEARQQRDRAQAEAASAFANLAKRADGFIASAERRSNASAADRDGGSGASSDIYGGAGDPPPLPHE